MAVAVLSDMFGASGFAHDVWITTEAASIGKIRAVIHHGHPGDRKVPDPDKVIELLLYRPDRPPESVLKNLASLPAAQPPVLKTAPIKMSTDGGCLIIAARYDNGYWVKTAEGHRNTSLRQVPTGEDSLFSMKFAKTLVQAGADLSEACQQRIGHRLELVPSELTGPEEERRVLIQVYFDGKPLPHADVESTDGLTPVEEDAIPRYKTDAQGRVVIPLSRRGPYLFVVDHWEPSVHPELASRELYNATLSIAVP
jgi:uncharacterized GH25 family protein